MPKFNLYGRTNYDFQFIEKLRDSGWGKLLRSLEH